MAMQREKVQEYYGKVLKCKEDLQTSSCCDRQPPPPHIQRIMEKLHIEVLERYYGCGLCIPDLLEGLTILDLGSGSGRDCFLLSYLVGAHGKVIGVDMTQEQIAVAKNHIDYHTKEFGYPSPNVEFVHGYIEDLKNAGIKDNSVDIIISNCVVNLSPDKEAVLQEAFRVLKNGGEMYFSDVYADRRIPSDLCHDPVLLGECLSGALYWNDFLRISKKVGFLDPRLVTSRPLKLSNHKLEDLIGHISFFSATYRLFKLNNLETDCEDYGQAVLYKGTIPTSPKEFLLDSHHSIQKGRIFPVCGNTFNILKSTRFSPHFEFFGDFSQHFGIFTQCGKRVPFVTTEQPSTGSQCCS